MLIVLFTDLDVMVVLQAHAGPVDVMDLVI